MNIMDYGEREQLTVGIAAVRWACIRRTPVLCLALVCLAVLWWRPAAAQSQPPIPPDAACRLCHADSTATMSLPSGEVIHAGVDLNILTQSVHGSSATAPVYCTDCHAPRQRYLYPHAENPAQSLADFRSDTAQNCEQCHVSAELHNPGHLLAEDNENLPNCVDCHSGHDVQPVAAMQADPVGSCQQCHLEFDDPALADVHTQVVANLGEGQTCETCHASAPQSEDALCQTCHSLLSSQLELASGDTIDLNVDPQVLVNSVHGDRVIEGVQYTSLRCTDCHMDKGVQGFPHEPVAAETRRQRSIDMQQSCQECHAEIYEKNADGVHGQHIAEGQLQAATCTDCHGHHDIQDPANPRQRISETCGSCHSAINEQYVMSVHGAALLGDDNPDVPVCTDCHGAHLIEDPTTAQFRVSSPNMCGSCHADVDLMAKYNISTDVFNTYVADFHGTTVTLFEHESPHERTNMAVCYDCHGVHNILPATDENSQVIKANLLATCQQCHPDATENFPDAWTSHYKPSLEHYPIVYFVDLFYAIVIPATVGGFVLFIGSDIFRRVRERFQRKRGEEKDE